jgi:hypothetical protein
MPDAAIAATAAPTVIGEARNYDELLALLKRRRDQLRVSLEVIDAISGFPHGYAAKLFAPTKIRTLGQISLPLVLGTLGVKLLVAIDQEAYERVKKRLNFPPEALSRRKNPRPNSRSELRGNSEWARVMNARRSQKVGRKRRAQIAAHAAAVRWAAHRSGAGPLV